VIVLDIVMIVALVGAFVAQMLRWLRVLQREHYEAGSMSRFLGRWSSPQVGAVTKNKSRLELADHSPRLAPPDDFVGAPQYDRDKLAPKREKPKYRPITFTQVLVVVFISAVIVREPVFYVAVAVLYGVTCPVGLSMKGQTSPLAWTRRLVTIAVFATFIALAISLLGISARQHWLPAVVVVWAVPVILDVTARALKPYENRRAQTFVNQAVTRLARVHPRVVAITGSYGKTSTKNHVVDLLGVDGGVVATPRSFNNRAGLSRAINENLADGTRVFIAEMGTYRAGEIRALCVWCVPEIAVITAIGPVHLERMKTLAVIESAKFEITEKAKVIIVNVDDPVLARWPTQRASGEKRYRSAGSVNADASVRVRVDGDQWTVLVDNEVLGGFDAIASVQPTNLACAIAVALELGTPSDQMVARASSVRPIDNRSNVVTAASGVVVIDDTFNANPQSALSALKTLSRIAETGRRVVVTPGLVELGREQYPENLALAQKVAGARDELVIVKRTNALPLETGYKGPVRRFNSRDEAVAWVRSSLVAGDGVLYLNDLPDHYP
jgi:UDP-N-acetylmuramoyl-tripeptide--D-alanyl-D-alanine ligase